MIFGCKVAAGVQAAEISDPRYEIEMCLRAMAAVYDAHAHHVGPCKGVPYLVSMLDHAEAAAVRERLVTLLVALVAPKAAFAAESAPAPSPSPGRPSEASGRSSNGTSAGSPRVGAAGAAVGAGKAAAAAKANGREIMAAGASGSCMQCFMHYLLCSRPATGRGLAPSP